MSVISPLYLADRQVKQSYETESLGEALAAVERAQEFNPFDPLLPQREAELAIQTDDWDRVKESYEKARQLNPEHCEPYMLSAAFHERRGELRESRTLYQKASAFNPLDVELKQRIVRLQDTN